MLRKLVVPITNSILKTRHILMIRQNNIIIGIE